MCEGEKLVNISPYVSKIPRPGKAGKLTFTIVGEIFCYSTTSSDKDKVVCLQRLEFDLDGHSELRLCFYMYDGAKWKFHRAAPMLSFEDFQAIIHDAIKKGWPVKSH